MKNIVSAFVKYPFYANLIVVVLLLAGTFSMLNMKKSFFPERNTTTIMVNVAYPGASPKEMEEGITTRVEEALRGLIGIKEITSTSSENFASIRVETTGKYDIDLTLAEVKNAVDGISAFPIDAEKPIVFKQRSSTMAAFLGLSGDVDLITLNKLADVIEMDFYNSGVISQLSVRGFPNLEISVEVSEINLLRYNLSFTEISSAIRNNNQDYSAGLIRNDKEEILIRSRSSTVDPDKIADIVIRAQPDGSQIRIRDVATVKMQFSETPQQTEMNGKLAISFNISKLADEDLEEITDFLRNYVEDFNASHDNAELNITFDFLSLLLSRLNLLYSNGLIGLILVLITLSLFLNVRLSLWVAWGIPASFLGMFIIASMAGITINMISLFGMILVIGILVDDGIVIAENIFQHFEMGKSPMKAAVEGTMEVLPAITTSVLTTMVAFMPLLLLTGQMEMMYEMAFVVVVSLGISLIEGFFVLPAHLSNPKILKNHIDKEGKDTTPWIRRKLDIGVAFLRDRLYGHVLKFMINWKWLALGLPISAFMITIGLFQGGLINYTFFPAMEFDQINIEIAYKPGSGEKQTLKALHNFEDVMWQVNEELMEEFADTNTFVKYTFVNLGSAFSGTESGAHAGSLMVTFRNMEDSPISTSQISARVRKIIGKIPDAEKLNIGGRNRWGSPVSISLMGKDLVELNHAKDFLKAELNGIDELKDITENTSVGKREVQIKLKPKAYFLGLSQAEIANQLRFGFFGGQAQRLQSGKDEIRVWVRYPQSDRLNIGQLENVKIKTMAGEYPLMELVDYDIVRGPVSIKHFNASREIRIDAELVDLYAPVPAILERVNAEILPRLEANYPGVSIMYQGQQRDGGDAQKEMMKYFGIAFAFMIIIIMFHFKSFSQSFIIILIIPLGWLGSVWGHGIEGFPVSILSAWGMVALSGVIINDSVVYLAKYNSLLLEGYSIKEAVYRAGISRFRPILLTTITTVAGLYPLILENSFQAQFLIPMAISLAYGVLFGTSFILLFFPPMILVLNESKRYYIGFKRMTGRLMSGEEIFDGNLLPDELEVEPSVRDSKRIIE
ncbi:MAG: efflux RND transporter permease subunit [Bacteroidales bacterium]|jgi:multidrug efflux pump subunit AcrB|nr:efflux RND transporter permease subunit [Bacteroidales bacterium]